MSLIGRLGSFVTWKPFQVSAFSQEGEDLILNRILGNQTSGFYVDIGAHHPQRFSNTYFFYLRGWRGVNIDAMPGSMRAFNALRPRDINLEIPVMKEKGRLTYYQFNEPALNGFSKELSEIRDGLDGFKVVKTMEIHGLPLSDILDSHLPSGQEIDFLSVDVEGLDQDVLESNDWTRFRPKVVLSELLTSSLSEMANDPIHRFMATNGYSVFAKAMNTVFFVRDDFQRDLFSWRTNPKKK